MKSEEKYSESLEAYKTALALLPEVELKGKTMPYTSKNGHMYSILSKEGTLGLRLDEAQRINFEKKYNTQPFKQYGAVMKEYVSVPDEVLYSPKKLTKYVQMSVAYIDLLEPK